MRAFAKGEPFRHITNDTIPDKIPVFCEGFLYGRMSKDDARFILAIAMEYEHIICVLGVDAVKALLAMPNNNRRPK